MSEIDDAMIEKVARAIADNGLGKDGPWHVGMARDDFDLTKYVIDGEADLKKIAAAALSACGYAEMRAEIERLRAMTTWRPIEDANKQSLDPVMIFNPSSYQGKGGMFIGIFMATRDSGGPHWFCHPSSVKAEPTHFLPLPPPPEAQP